MLVIDGGEPKILSLPQILDLYIEHQKSVIYRRVNYDLEKAKAKAEKKAIKRADEIAEMEYEQKVKQIKAGQ